MSMLGGVPILILKEGTKRDRGQDARGKNILAIQAVAEAVKSTLGPRGMDKMLVDGLGDITVTNDGATILDQLDVQHPGAKMAVAIARSQDDNVGDGTTSSVIIAGQLLEVANELIEQGIHPVQISRGFRIAGKEARKYLKEIALEIDIDKDQDLLKQVAITTMNSKGVHGAKEIFADLGLEAFSKVRGEKGTNMGNVKNIIIVKKKGQSIQESTVIDGIILEKEPINPMMPTVVHGAKIALIAQSFEVNKTEFSSDLRISNPGQIQQFLDEEEKILKNYADKIKAVGANVVINQKGIEDSVGSFLLKYGITAIKSVTKTDMIKLKKAIGGSIVENINSISADDLGSAELVQFKKVGGDDLCFISGCKNPKAVSILLRSGSNTVLDEADRTMHDALCVIASVHDRTAVVGGGGAVEMELRHKLRTIANEQPGKEQIAIEAFANALEVIPITLCENAGIDPITVVADLRGKHGTPGNEFVGIELYSGEIVDTRKMGLLEPVANIDQIIKASTELAIMILRIDDLIKSRRSAGPPPGMGGGGMGGMGGGMPPGMM